MALPAGAQRTPARTPAKKETRPDIGSGLDLSGIAAGRASGAGWTVAGFDEKAGTVRISKPLGTGGVQTETIGVQAYKNAKASRFNARQPMVPEAYRRIYQSTRFMDVGGTSAQILGFDAATSKFLVSGPSGARWVDAAAVTKNVLSRDSGDLLKEFGAAPVEEKKKAPKKKEEKKKPEEEEKPAEEEQKPEEETKPEEKKIEAVEEEEAAEEEEEAPPEVKPAAKMPGEVLPPVIAAVPAEKPAAKAAEKKEAAAAAPKVVEEIQTEERSAEKIREERMLVESTLAKEEYEALSKQPVQERALKGGGLILNYQDGTVIRRSFEGKVTVQQPDGNFSIRYEVGREPGGASVGQTLTTMRTEATVAKKTAKDRGVAKAKIFELTNAPQVAAIVGHATLVVAQAQAVVTAGIAQIQSLKRQRSNIEGTIGSLESDLFYAAEEGKADEVTEIQKKIAVQRAALPDLTRRISNVEANTYRAREHSDRLSSLVKKTQKDPGAVYLLKDALEKMGSPVPKEALQQAEDEVYRQYEQEQAGGMITPPPMARRAPTGIAAPARLRPIAPSPRGAGAGIRRVAPGVGGAAMFAAFGAAQQRERVAGPDQLSDTREQAVGPTGQGAASVLPTIPASYTTQAKMEEGDETRSDLAHIEQRRTEDRAWAEKQKEAAAISAAFVGAGAAAAPQEQVPGATATSQVPGAVQGGEEAGVAEAEEQARMEQENAEQMQQAQQAEMTGQANAAAATAAAQQRVAQQKAEQEQKPDPATRIRRITEVVSSAATLVGILWAAFILNVALLNQYFVKNKVIRKLAPDLHLPEQGLTCTFDCCCLFLLIAAFSIPAMIIIAGAEAAGWLGKAIAALKG